MPPERVEYEAAQEWPLGREVALGDPKTLSIETISSLQIGDRIEEKV